MKGEGSGVRGQGSPPPKKSELQISMCELFKYLGHILVEPCPGFSSIDHMVFCCRGNSFPRRLIICVSEHFELTDRAFFSFYQSLHLS